LNERIRELAPSSASASYDFVCECADDHCFEVVPMMVAEFDAVSAKAGRYVVARGHERPRAEDVVERHERYVVVSRPLPAAQTATAARADQGGSDHASSG
jgi:hypothetical protein